jgi:hypothetical protein
MSEADNAAAPSIPAKSSPASPAAQPAPQQETAGGVAAALPDPIPHAGPRYAVHRLLVLVAVGGALYVIGMRGWLLAFAAVLVSGIISLFLLRKQRNDVAVVLERTVGGWRHRRDPEDAELAQE